MFPFLDTHPGGGLPTSRPSNVMWMTDWARAGQDHGTHKTREGDEHHPQETCFLLSLSLKNPALVRFSCVPQNKVAIGPA